MTQGETPYSNFTFLCKREKVKNYRDISTQWKKERHPDE
jgi:hypothetical protein